MSPDRPFASVPYAFSAGTAQSAGSANIANGSVSLDMLSQDVKSQINAPIGLNRLSAEVTAKLIRMDQEEVVSQRKHYLLSSGQPAPSGFASSAGNAQGIGLGGEGFRECGKVCTMEWKF